MKYDHILRQLDRRISSTRIILDNQSTVDIFSSKNILQNIRHSNRNLDVLFMGRKTTTNMVGELAGYGTMWFHPGGIANIPSLYKFAKKYQVSYNSTNIKKILFIYLVEKCTVSNSILEACSTPI